MLLCLFGCNVSPGNDRGQNAEDANPPAAINADNSAPSTFAVPRPNSGKFSTDEATKLLLQFLRPSEGADFIDSPSKDQILASAEKVTSKSGIFHVLFEGATDDEESMVVEIYMNSEKGEYFSVERNIGD